METQIPEPPGCRRAVTGRSCCSCCQDTCPSAARHPLGQFQTTCQPSQGGRRRRNLAAFLFKRKEEKIPNHTKNKTNNEKEFRVALLALCALWWLPRLSLPGGPSAVHVHLTPTRASGTDSSHQLCATRPGHPPASPPVAEGMGCVSGLFLPLSYHRTHRQGAACASARAASISAGWGGSWLWSVCSFSCVPT